MYYKLTENGVVLDLLTETKWVKYLPNLKCFVGTDKNSANAIMGNDNNTIYHIKGRDYNFSEKLVSVTVEEIDEKEYNNLSTQLFLQEKNDAQMKIKLSALQEQISQQNELLEAIYKKLF